MGRSAKKQLARRFWAFVDRSGKCWLWRGSRAARGYGRFMVGSRRDGTRKSERAHRVAWELKRGPIPAGLCVLHRCDNPPCVRPAHLWLGTCRDNFADMRAKGRGRNGARVHRGERHSLAKLTRAEVEEIRRGYEAGGTSQRELGKRFGVGQTQISRIIRGHRWREGNDVPRA